MGFATVAPEAGGKKLYAATDEGRAELETHRRTLDAIKERMDEARSRGGRFSPQIMRAMENLKTALRYRLTAGELTEADVTAIAAAIDAAALAVERKAGGAS
jgi:DNA-binding PadR family transcriptional regulator